MRKPFKIITVIGARPQIIKASAISRAISSDFVNELQEIIVHTGQHYDENMSQNFFSELGIPQPAYNLEVGSGSHGAQTAKMLDGLEKIFLSEKPNAVLVYGDTNSTIAGALAASKIHIPVIHVEAGLRSFNKSMPEEINRIACDHMSTLLFSPTKSGIDNLKREGFKENEKKATIDHPKMFHCGDVMLDNSLYFSTISDVKSTILSDLNLIENEFILGTIHRDSNTDDLSKLDGIVRALIAVANQSKLKIVLPLHPRTKLKMEHLPIETLKKMESLKDLLIIPPVGFLDVIALEKNAKLIVTDSGGLQKEAYFFKKPCVILREQTEWIEIVESGNAKLTHVDEPRIVNACLQFIEDENRVFPQFYGDGNAAKFICQTILNELA